MLLLIVVIEFTAIEPRMLNRQIEEVCLRLAGVLPCRKIVLALLIYKQVRDGMIDLYVVQVPLAPNQGNDLDANLNVIDGQQRRLCSGSVPRTVTP